MAEFLLLTTRLFQSPAAGGVGGVNIPECSGPAATVMTTIICCCLQPCRQKPAAASNAEAKLDGNVCFSDRFSCSSRLVLSHPPSKAELRFLSLMLWHPLSIFFFFFFGFSDSFYSFSVLAPRILAADHQHLTEEKTATLPDLLWSAEAHLLISGSADAGNQI